MLFFNLTVWGGDYQILGVADSKNEPIKGLMALGYACAAVENPALTPESFDGLLLLHMQGSSLESGICLEKSMALARAAGGVKVSLELNGSRLIEKYKERILGLIAAYIDVLFLNEEECYQLTRLTAEKAAAYLNHICPLVVILTKEGAWVSSKRECFHSPKIEPVLSRSHSPRGEKARLSSTTSNLIAPNPEEIQGQDHQMDYDYSEDLKGVFTAAFLYGYLQGFSPKTSAKFGHIAGSQLAQKQADGLSSEMWSELKKSLK